MSQSSAFISYHHSDELIGDTLYDQLMFLAEKGKGRPKLTCFLDVRDIRPGEPWQPVIDKALQDMDWLIVVFTGEQSVYCGYEIGIFSQLHAMSMKEVHPTRRIMGLHDVEIESIPVVLRLSKNTPVRPVLKPVEMNHVLVEAAEIDEWFNSKLGRFLREFCDYKQLYTTQDEANNPSAYGINIATAAKKISNAFFLAQGTDVRNETQSQLGFEIDILRAGETALPAIPPESNIVGTSHAFSILGLNFPTGPGEPPHTTWEKLNRILQISRGGQAPWLHKVETDVIRAVENLMPSSEDTTFIGSNGRVYRPILVRHKLFVNGDRRFYILLIETLDRRFAGAERSSLILTAIILASRLRFTYFEKWSDTANVLFGETTPIQKFADACKQLYYTIQWIELESAEFGITDKSKLCAAFGQENRARVERFFVDWEAAKDQLAHAYGGVDIEVTIDNRDAIRAAVITFLENARSQNSDFLELSIKTYSELIHSELSLERLK